MLTTSFEEDAPMTLLNRQYVASLTPRRSQRDRVRARRDSLIHFSPWVDLLEQRTLLSSMTYTVTSPADALSGGTLRQAIIEANANPGNDTIAFSLPTNSTIALTMGALMIDPATTGDGRVDRGQKFNDVLKCPQSAELLRLDRRGVRESLLHGGEDFDPLDRVDAEVGIKTHGRVEHVDRVAGFVADDPQQRFGHLGDADLGLGHADRRPGDSGSRLSDGD